METFEQTPIYIESESSVPHPETFDPANLPNQQDDSHVKNLARPPDFAKPKNMAKAPVNFNRDIANVQK